MTTETTAPHSPQAERAVLGALMLDNNVFDDVADILRPEYFHSQKHRRLYETIQHQATHGEPFDAVTLADRLGSDFLAPLIKLTTDTPSTANAARYAQLIRDAATRRHVMAACDQVHRNAAAGDMTTDALLDDASRAFLEIPGGHSDPGPLKISECLAGAVDRIDARAQRGEYVTGLPTGYADLDKLTAGFQPGDFVVIAGRPSMGKTAFAMNIAGHTVLTGASTLVFSLEQPREQLTDRLLAATGPISLQQIRTGQLSDGAWPKLTAAVGTLDGVPLFVDDSCGLTVHQIRARSRRFRREHGLDLIIIDYLQLMRGEGQNRTQEIGNISTGLKALAKELRVPVIALSQLNRSLMQRTDKRPVMSDLRDSGNIEQDADIILFLYRDEIYNEDSPHKGLAELHLAKHRNGPTGRVVLTFRGQYCRFENYSGDAVSMAPGPARFQGGFDG